MLAKIFPTLYKTNFVRKSHFLDPILSQLNFLRTITPLLLALVLNSFYYVQDREPVSFLSSFLTKTPHTNLASFLHVL
jgi:hypothetical protein